MDIDRAGYPAVLTRLLAIVGTVRSGDPFIAANADRLQAIAWVLLALQPLSLTVGASATGPSWPNRPRVWVAHATPAAWLPFAFIAHWRGGVVANLGE